MYTPRISPKKGYLQKSILGRWWSNTDFHGVSDWSIGDINASRLISRERLLREYGGPQSLIMDDLGSVRADTIHKLANTGAISFKKLLRATVLKLCSDGERLDYNSAWHWWNQFCVYVVTSCVVYWDRKCKWFSRDIKQRGVVFNKMFWWSKVGELGEERRGGNPSGFYTWASCELGCVASYTHTHNR